MNQLPQHRQIVYGRTHDRTYDPASYDPIQGFARRTEWRATIVMTLLAVAVLVGVMAGVM